MPITAVLDKAPVYVLAIISQILPPALMAVAAALEQYRYARARATAFFFPSEDFRGEMSENIALTPEMIARMERNRAAALEKRKRARESDLTNGNRSSHYCDDIANPALSIDLQQTQRMSSVLSEVSFQRIDKIPCDISVQSSSMPGVMPVHQAASALKTKSVESGSTNAAKQLSSEQDYVFGEVMSGKNVFLTGCGGTGKSFLTNHLITALKEKYGKTSVAITATTGIAACQIGGTSLHNFAGIGLGNGTVEELVDRISRNKRVCDRWKKTKCLIVDEISMLDGDLFDKLEAVAREIRKDDRPFGGIQLLLVGDFLQLPPIKKNGQVKFCFEGNS